MSIKSIFVVGALVLSANTAFASTVKYTDYSSWTDDVAGVITTDTFNEYNFTGSGSNFVNFGSSTILGGITYSTDGGTIFGINKNLGYDATYLKSNYLEWENDGKNTLIITLSAYTNGISDLILVSFTEPFSH